MAAFRFWTRRTDDQYVEGVRKYRGGWVRKATIVAAIAAIILWTVIVAYASSFLDVLIDDACSSVEREGQLDSETVEETVRLNMRLMALMGCFLGVCIGSLAGSIGLLMSSVWDRRSRLLVKYYDLAQEKTDDKSIKAIQQSITTLVKQMTQNEKLLACLKSLAPQLSKKIQHCHLLVKKKNIERDR